MRNGQAEVLTVSTGAGPIEIEAPRVNDKRVDGETGGAGPVPQLDRAAVVPQGPEGGRGAAAHVPARHASGDFVTALEEQADSPMRK